MPTQYAALVTRRGFGSQGRVIVEQNEWDATGKRWVRTPGSVSRNMPATSQWLAQSVLDATWGRLRGGFIPRRKSLPRKEVTAK